MIKKISLTGDRPTGSLHIGHYFGSIVSRKELESEYESFVMVADVQALTDNFKNPEKVRDNVLKVVADNIAAGLDPQKTTFFIQSLIPQIAELTIFFSNLITINALKRNPTVKAEIAEKKDLFGQEGESLTYGFLGYPVSQAADIAIVRADAVPVGEDQLPMIEQTREILEKFHRIYGKKVFPLPEARLSRVGRIIGLDGGLKMGKSLGNAIFLKDSPDEITAKIKTAKTDSGSSLEYKPKERPEISNLVLIYSLINNIRPEDAKSDLSGINYNVFKEKLANDLSEFLKPIREKRSELMSDQNSLKQVLEDGTERVRKEAEKTMSLVREAMKINYK